MAHEPDGVIDFGATPSTTTPASGDPNIDGILIGTEWIDHDLTYSFPSISGDYGAGYIDNLPDGFSAATAKQETAVETWLGMFADVSGLTFTELDGAPGAQDEDQEATLRFANSTLVSTARVADFPDNAEEGGDVWFGGTGDDPDLGDFDFVTVGHELGHAVGLAHGHSSSGLGTLPFDVDSSEFSIMTYTNYIGENAGFNTNATWHNPQSLMMLDIAALQFIYGANFATNSGSTTYTFSTTTGEMFVNGVGQGTPGANIVFRTVWDGNGTDTYDLSNYTTDLDIDLRPGEFSDFDTNGDFQRADLGFGDPAAGPGVEMSRGHLFNALQFNSDTRSLIENANGGSGDDNITGNAANNVLRGNAGDDNLFGGDGADDFYGGSGTDDFYGGDGNDDFFFDASEGPFGASFQVSAGTGTDEIFLQGVGTFDFTGLNVSNLEEIVFGSGDQTLILSNKELDSATELLNVTIDGFLGGSGSEDDIVVNLDFTNSVDLSGWTFQDWDNVNDSITINGSSVSNTITGTSQDDQIFGYSGNDTLIGGGGDDTFTDTENAAPSGEVDTHYGGAGSDTVIADINWSGSVLFDLAAGLQTVAGSARDVYSSIENLVVGGDADVIGSASANTITMTDLDGDNSISAGSGDDVVYGGGGDDEINGDAGSDLIYGGDGNDTVIDRDGSIDSHYGGSGTDTIDYNWGSWASSVTFDLALGRYTVGASIFDTFLEFENLIFSGDADAVGSNVANTITGGDGDNSISAGGGDDVVYGGDGDDEIDGDAGSDLIYGGDGNDTVIDRDGTIDSYHGGTGIDTIDYNWGSWTSLVTFDLALGRYTVGASIFDTFLGFENLIFSGDADAIGSNVANTITGGDGDNSIHSGDGADVIYGGDGNDILDNTGTSGEFGEEMYGGAGNDTILAGDSGSETMDGGAGIDTVDTSEYNGSYNLDMNTGATNFTEIATNFENAIFGNGANNVVGTSDDNTITTNGGADSVDGGAGDDLIYGGDGADTLIGGTNVDVLYGGSGNDTLDGGLFVDAVYGGDGDDVNTVSLNHLADDFYGGAGTDTIDISGTTSGGGAIIDLAAGTMSYFGTLDVVGVENAIGTSMADTITGTAGSNVLDGDDGADLLDAGVGDDTLDGGSGDDTLIGGAGADSIDGGADTDTVDYSASAAGIALLLNGTASAGGDAEGDRVTNVEIAIGSAFDDTITSNATAHTLDGGAGDDTLIGAGGADLILGGTGNDSVNAGTGGDTVDGGDGDDEIFGSSGADSILGGLDDDLLFGGSGADTVDGGDGEDQVFGSVGADSLAGGAGNDTVNGGTGDDEVYGGTGNDSLLGSSDDDELYGGDGNDTLDGGSGDDEAYGGIGDDRITGGSGRDELFGGDGNDAIDGGGSGDSLFGQSGDDTLTGGTGDDALYGGDDADTVSGEDGEDQVFGGGGADLVYGGADNDTAYGGGGADSVEGGDGDDLLFGSVGNDTIAGGSGNDEAYGGLDDDHVDGGIGNDEVFGASGDDTVLGGDGDDTVNGGTGNDTVLGGADDDLLIGSSGDDVLIGGSGNDTLNGGSGSDVFVFEDALWGMDTVTGWQDGQDLFDFTAAGLGFADFTQSAQGGGTLLTLTADANQTVFLDGIAAGTIDQFDFV